MKLAASGNISCLIQISRLSDFRGNKKLTNSGMKKKLCLAWSSGPSLLISFVSFSHLSKGLSSLITHSFLLTPPFHSVMAAFLSTQGMSITKFPEELVVKIALHIGFEDMCVNNFSMTCSQFHTLLLPYILGDEVSYLQQMVRKRKLRIMTEPHGNDIYDFFALADLEDIYNMPMRAIMAKPVGDDKDLRCLYRLLYRVTNVGTIIFSLEDYNATLPPRSRARKLATLLNVVAEKNTKFQVVGQPFDWDGEPGPFMFNIYNNFEGIRTSRQMDTRHSGQSDFQFQKHQEASGITYKSTARKMREIYSLAKESFPGQLTSTSPTVPPEVVVKTRKGRFEVPLLKESRLTSLEVECAIPFLASFSRSTFTILNSTRLTELIVGYMSFSEYEWACILTNISLPALTNVGFVNLALAFSDLRKFLARHSTISTLDLSSNTFRARKFKLPVRGLRPFLPHLTFLQGKPSLITPFLRYISRFPRLSEVHLRIVGGKKGHEPDLILDVHKEETLSTFYFALMELPPRRISLRIDSLYASSFVEWMEGSRWYHEDRRYRSFPSLHTLFIDMHSFGLHRPDVLQGLIRLGGWSVDSGSINSMAPDEISVSPNQEKEIVEAFIWKRCPNLRTIRYNNAWIKVVSILCPDQFCCSL